MKKNGLKAFAFLLGTSLIVSSCVKTEELDSVKAIREAKAASLTADANYKNSQASYQLADAAYRKYTRWADSVSSVANLASLITQNSINAAQAQLAIAQANKQIDDLKLQAQISQKSLQDQLDQLKLTNPLAAAMASDYNSYYFGGNLSTGGSISKGIYNLRGSILTDQGNLITYKLNQGNAVATKLVAINNATKQLLSDSATLVGDQLQLALYQSAKTDGTATALIAAKAAAATALADLQSKSITKDAADKAKNAASSLYTNAITLYSTAQTDSTTAATTCKTKLASYNNDLNQLQQAIKRQSDVNAIDKVTADNFLQALTDTTAALNIATNNYNNALAIENNAIAIVTAANLNGGTATLAQTAAVTSAHGKTVSASTRLNGVTVQYNFLKTSYATANVAYQNDLASLKTLQTTLQDYNTAKTVLDNATAKLPVLRADMNTKKADYDAKTIVFNNAKNAFDTADVISTNANNAVITLKNLTTLSTTLPTPYYDLDNVIKTFKNNVITDNNTIINDLQALTNAKNSTNTIDQQIKNITDEIAEYQALVDNYLAKAAALKIKIDAAQ